MTWCSFWCCVWFGTAVGGSAFGLAAAALVTLLSAPSQIYWTVLVGPIVGGLYAGLVGLFVIPSFALLVYTCFLCRRPLVLAGVAGALTGLVSLLPLCFLTAPAGAFGAYYFAKWYLSTPDSWLIREAEERRLENRNQPFNFTIASLFARTAAAAVLIAFWTFLIRAWYG